MNKWIKRLLCLALCLAVAASCLPAAFAEEPREMHIQTAEDLLRLAESCSLDTWSDGLTVYLDNDITLSGSGFDSIPIFNGTFEGQGHTIYDMTLTDAQSPCGFILETGQDALIRSLKITGTVAPRGDDSQVGGFVGLNRGTLMDCGFTGTVSAKSQVGGIVGQNEATGLVSGCAAAGTVLGLSETGGIAGHNAGALFGCESAAFVNTESVDPALRLDSIDTSSILNFVKSLQSDNAGITSDTGGVAGASTGFVEVCGNTGTVGYLHLGYNVGGVVGRSSGYVRACTNSGEVYGRRDVGGIVGQAEPFIEVEQAQNLLAGLSYRMYALNQSIDNAIADAGGYSDVLVGQLSLLPGYLRPVADAVAGIDLTDPASAMGLQDVISSSVHSIASEMDSISANMDGSSDVLIADFQDINNNVNALSSTALQAMTLLSGAEEADILSDDSASGGDDGITLGKVADCSNTGSVYGDNNVGGIAGSLSVENELDPEDSLNISHNALVKNRFSLRSVIVHCASRADVTAKRECVGGIVGRMDFGYLANSAAYGSARLEDGDYAGGICGLSYGTIRNCAVKISLSGGRYVGGILGNGYNAQNDEEKSSLVAGCYSLAQILEDPQFAGAVSGGSDGVYEGNYFVPMGYAGMDKLSIHGKAEPMRFEDFAQVPNLPADCTSFVLRFTVEGATVKEIPFAYGDSFDRSAFPKVEKRDGAYAVWDRSDLTNLNFDTVVNAEYRMDETVLRSALNREDGRAAVYVDGQFQEGDRLELTQLEIGEGEIDAFRGDWRQTVREQLRSIFREGEPDYSVCVGVEEELRLSFPDDGLQTHTLRYLTPDGSTENHRIYLRTESGWQRLHPDSFGSYYLVEVPGTSATLALIDTIQSWWIVTYIAGAMLLLTGLVILLVKLVKAAKRRKKREKSEKKTERAEHRRTWRRAHRKGLILGGAGLVLAAVAAVLIVRFSSISTAFETYRLLKDFAAQESAIQTQIDVHSEVRDLSISTQVLRVKAEGRMIGYTEQYGIPIYFNDGMVYLENGRTFVVSGSTLDQNAVLNLALEVFRNGEIRKSVLDGETRYTAALDADTANEILSLILSGNTAGLLNADSMTAEMDAADGTLSALRFSGEGETESGKRFSLTAGLIPAQIDQKPEIPRAVLEAINHPGADSKEILSEELLMLLAAWMKNDSADTVKAHIAVQADCGALSLDTDYEYYRQKTEGTDVHCVAGRLFKLYFTDEAACTESGMPLSAAEQNAADAAQLMPLAKELCLKGEFDSGMSGDLRIYSVSLDPETALELAGTLVPELRRLKLELSDCVLKIALQESDLVQIELDCDGSIRVVSRDVESRVKIAARYVEPDGPLELPPAVQRALLGASGS